MDRVVYGSEGSNVLGDTTVYAAIKMIANFFRVSKPVEEKAKQQVVEQSEYSAEQRRNRSMISSMIVSKEEFEKIEASSEEKEGIITVETPDEDARIIERLLGIPKGTLIPTFVDVAEEGRCCANCDRPYSFLDQVSTGLAVHNRQFLKDIVLGTYGYVYNPNPPQKHNCYNCGVPGIISFYSYFYNCYRCSY